MAPSIAALSSKLFTFMFFLPFFNLAAPVRIRAEYPYRLDHVRSGGDDRGRKGECRCIFDSRAGKKHRGFRLRNRAAGAGNTRRRAGECCAANLMMSIEPLLEKSAISNVGCPRSVVAETDAVIEAAAPAE